MQYGYWKVRVIQKHRLPASWRHLIPGVFLLTLGLLSLLSACSFLLSAVAPNRQLGSLVTGHWSLVSLIALLSTYAVAMNTASLITAARTEWKLLPALPVVFACYHFGFGYGFLRGIWDFVIWSRKPNTNYQSLTR
jgi:hypothetical protein